MSGCSSCIWHWGCFSAEPDDVEELTTKTQTTRKVVVVGDGLVGKTSLLMRYVTDRYDEHYQPTIFDNQAAPVTVDKKKVLLGLFDTAGQEGYEHLRPLAYPESDVILICFAVDDRDSLTNVLKKWQPEIRCHLGNVPLLLLGLKSDLRADGHDLMSNKTTTMSQPLMMNDSLAEHDNMEMWDKNFVSYSDGQKMAERIGAKAYFECSSRLNRGLTPIFLEAARLALKRRKASRGGSLRNLLPSSKRSYWSSV